MAPAMSGKSPRARFWTTSMIPSPVPNKAGFTSMGTVGTMTVQKMAIQTPSSVVGTHLIQSVLLIATLVSKYIMNT